MTFDLDTYIWCSGAFQVNFEGQGHRRKSSATAEMADRDLKGNLNQKL